MKVGEFNDFELVAVGKSYTVRINGVATARMTNLDDYRGKRADEDSQSGLVGFLMRRGRVALRRVLVEPLPDTASPNPSQPKE